MKVSIIDYRDSFTYNLVQIVREAGSEVDVVSGSLVTADRLAPADKVILSPGPGLPAETPGLAEAIRICLGRKPLLGVCLGHQGIAEFFGARLEQLHDVFHGVASECRVTRPDKLFRGIGPKFHAGRYHSWVVSRESLPDCLEVTAETADGLVMALRHKQLDLRGMQFHPESVLTPLGSRIIKNWLQD